MNKWITSALAVALTAGVAMGASVWFNGSIDNSWDDAANWTGGTGIPTADDDAFRRSGVDGATCVVSSSNTVKSLRIGMDGTSSTLGINTTLIMTNAFITAITNGTSTFNTIAYNRTGGSLIMYNSTFQSVGIGSSLIVGRNNGGVFMDGTLSMYDGSVMTLTGNLTLYDNQLVGTVGQKTGSVNLFGGSTISTPRWTSIDNGYVRVNSGSWITIRTTLDDADIDTMISEARLIVDGTTVTALNKATYVYKDATNTYVIPEPATALLFGIGGIGAWMLRRSKIKSQEEDGSDA